MRSAAAILAVLSCVTCVCGCSKVSTSGQRSVNSSTLHGVVRYSISSDINTLNPTITTLAVEQAIDEAIFDGLVELDDRQRVVPDLATEVPSTRNGGISKDGRTLIYHLRRGVRWQDGQPLTAGDVLFTFHTILNPHVNASNTAIYQQVQSISAPDPYTVVVQLKSPSAPAVAQLFCNGESGEIIPQHLLAHSRDFNRDPFGVRPVGSGPMQIDLWERGARVLLKPNPHYFRGVPRIHELQILFIPDTNTRLTMATTKELDVTDVPLATQLARLRGMTGYSVSLVRTYTGVHATFNVTRPPFDDVHVRQALTMALNRKTLVVYTYGEAGIPADSALPPYSWAYTADNHSMPYDPVRARALLDQAGWKLGPRGIRVKGARRLEFSLLTYAGSTPRAILAQQMQNDWRAVGADAAIRPMPVNVLFSRGSILNTAKFDVALEGFIYDPDPDRSSNFGSGYFSPIGVNDSRFSDPQTDTLLARGIALYDPQERRRVYALLQQRLNELVPAIFIAWPESIYVVNNDLHGFKPEPVNSDFWNIYEWNI